MKKILIAHDLKAQYLEGYGLLDRADIAVFTAATNNDLLKTHEQHLVDLIITQLDMPGMESEKLFHIIRKNKKMRNVPIVVICENTNAQRNRCEQCKVDAIFSMPVDVALLHMKAQQFLNIEARQAYRAALNVVVEGKYKNKPFVCRTENISATGMLIRAQGILAQGDRISFSFSLPDGKRVSALGEIVRIVKEADTLGVGLYGLKYTEIDPAAKSDIEAYVKTSET